MSTMTDEYLDPSTWEVAVRRVARTFHDRGRAAAFGREARRAKAASDALAGAPHAPTAELLDDLLKSLRASHTARLTAGTAAYYEALAIYGGAADLKRSLRGLFPPDAVVTYEGIGWRTGVVGGRTFAKAVYDGGPAARAGMLVGDEVVAIDGVAPQEVESFRGKTGRRVQVEIRRTREGALRTLPVVPERIEPKAAFLDAMRDSVRVRERDGYLVGSIRPWSYAGEAYHALLESELSRGRLRQADALVLDLRGGWGGAAPEYANLFVGGAPTMTLIDRSGTERAASFRWRRPLVGIVDEETRSGKEVLAWALQRRGVCLVGSRTAGAVLGGQASLLPDGSLLMVAVRDVLVDGVRLEGVGVAPDLPVSFHLPYAGGCDPQMETALSQAARLCRAESDLNR
jgi:carboxyl-terminal processing protease